MIIGSAIEFSGEVERQKIRSRHADVEIATYDDMVVKTAQRRFRQLFEVPIDRFRHLPHDTDHVGRNSGTALGKGLPCAISRPLGAILARLPRIIRAKGFP